MSIFNQVRQHWRGLQVLFYFFRPMDLRRFLPALSLLFHNIHECQGNAESVWKAAFSKRTHPEISVFYVGCRMLGITAASCYSGVSFNLLTAWHKSRSPLNTIWHLELAQYLCTKYGLRKASVYRIACSTASRHLRCPKKVVVETTKWPRYASYVYRFRPTPCA